MSKKRKTLLRFSGPPKNLTANVSLARASGVQPALRLNDKVHIVHAFGDEDHINKLALTLPPDTPPGQIKSCVEIGNKSYDAIIDVQQATTLRFEPAALDVRASAGDTVAATLNVTNLGNQALSYEADAVITLRPSGALARSIKNEFKNRSSDFADRLINIGKDLAAAESHELNVAGHMNSTTLNTGESGTVEFEFEMPADLQPQTKWTGSLAVLGARVRVNVETTNLN